MYKTEFQGCLSLIIFLAILFFIIAKLWWLIVGLIIIGIVYYYSKLIYLMYLNKQNDVKINYEPKEGEVFKVCPNCNAKARVSAIACPRCNHPLN